MALTNAVLPPFMDMAVSAKKEYEKSRPLLVGFFKFEINYKRPNWRDAC
ncbi:MAG: hypothetical protein ACRDNG_02370 [Gaiellaceae bacterium]